MKRERAIKSPGRWQFARLADIADVRLGRQRSPARAFGQHMRRYLRAANVTWRGLDLTDVKSMDFRPAEQDVYQLWPGDILLAEASGSPSEVGKAAVYRGELAPCCFQNTLIRVRGSAEMTAFLHLHFIKDAVLGNFADASRGVGIHHLGAESLSNWTVTVPPIQEQQRIVEAVESYLSRLDAAVASLERTRARLKAYRASVLKAAVEGRLVPTEADLARAEKRDYEPVDVLLKRILVERRRRWEEAEFARLTAAGKTPKDDKWKSKYQEPTAPDTSGLPKLPEGWCWASLEQLLFLLRNGQSMPPRETSGVRTLRISAVRPLSVDFEDVRYLPGMAADYADDIIQTDDLLFTRYNGTRSLVGVCARVGFLTEPTVHPDKLIKVRLIPEVSARFVEVAMNAGASRTFIERRSRTTAGQTGISGADLKSAPVPIPPLAEQNRIADAVEDRLSVADKLTEACVSDLRRVGRLRQAILKWAFEGKLVDQDPNDEPAEKLLERVRAERAAAEPARTRRARPRKSLPREKTA